MEYMNKVNRPEKTKRRIYIQHVFLYPEEVKETRFMWGTEIVESVRKSDNTMILVNIGWDEVCIVCGESAEIKER